MATRSIANRNNFIRWDKMSSGVTAQSIKEEGLPPFAPVNSGKTNWELRDAASASEWGEVAFGNGLYVAIADTGEIMSSPDGDNWTSRTAPEANDWKGLAYGNNRWVAVSQDGTNRVMTSPDGITWSSQSAAEQNSWVDLAFGNGLFVAVSPTGTNRIMTSIDGQTWNAVAAPEANQWRCVTFGNGRFVSISQDGTNRVMYSDDGVNWTATIAAQASSWESVTYGNGLFVAVADAGTDRLMTSENGIGWTAINIEANVWLDIAFGSNLFVAVAFTGTNRIITSSDGVTWTAEQTPTQNQWRGVGYGNNKFIIVSNNGNKRVAVSSTFSSPQEYGNQNQFDDIDNTVCTLFRGDLFSWYANLDTAETATDFDRWELSLLNAENNIAYENIDDIKIDVRSSTIGSWAAQSAISDTWQGVAYGNGLFVAVAGSGGVSTSPDGVTWTARTAAEANNWRAVTFGNGIFVAVADNSGSNNVMTSPDGVNWTARSALLNTEDWRDIIYAKGLFVAVGNGAPGPLNFIMYSYDGIIWTAANDTGDSILKIAYGDGVFLATAATDGDIIRSSDGINWTTLSTAPVDNWVPITYGNGTFVALEQSSPGLSIYSTDQGDTWTQTTPTPNNDVWRDITFGNGLFVGVQSSQDDTIYSFDGITWNTLTEAENNQWQSVTFGNGLFVAVSLDGTNRAMTLDYDAQYNFYNEYEVPTTLSDGCYKLAIINRDNNFIRYLSNQIKVSNSIAAYTNYIQYRNDKNILNFNYEGLPNYKNSFRIDLIIRQPNYEVDRIGYDLIDGSFLPVRSVKGQNLDFITEAYNKDDHEAFNAATVHTLEVFEDGSFRVYVRSEDDYTPDWQVNYPLADGSIRLQRKDTFDSNKNV